MIHIRIRIFALALFAVSTAACSATQQTTNTIQPANRTASDPGDARANHNGAAGTGHGNMNHAGMDHADMRSSPDAASAPYDLQFLDTMIPHHQGAIDMARPAVEKAQHPELREFARKIIADQEREIGEMRRIRERLYAGKPEAMNMEMPGMTDSMKGMDMQKLNAATGNDFDLMFLEQMIPHHDGAVVMSRDGLGKLRDAEVKRLANQIIASQQEEVAQMNRWRESWRKR